MVPLEEPIPKEPLQKNRRLPPVPSHNVRLEEEFVPDSPERLTSIILQQNTSHTPGAIPSLLGIFALFRMLILDQPL